MYDYINIMVTTFVIFMSGNIKSVC